MYLRRSAAAGDAHETADLHRNSTPLHRIENIETVFCTALYSVHIYDVETLFSTAMCTVQCTHDPV